MKDVKIQNPFLFWHKPTEIQQYNWKTGAHCITFYQRLRGVDSPQDGDPCVAIFRIKYKSPVSVLYNQLKTLHQWIKTQ